MTRLLNSPLAVRRVVALLTLLTLTSMIVLCGIFAWLSVVKAQSAIHEQRSMLGRLQSAISQMSDWTDSSNLAQSGASFGFLSGQSETIIRAELQQRFMTAATRHEVGVISVGNVPNVEKDQVNYAGLQANVSGTIEHLQQLLIELETTNPILFIPDLTIRAPDTLTRASPSVAPQLEAQMRVYGALRPDNEAGSSQ